MVAKNKGGRPSGEKTRCGGVWTEARYKSFIKSTLRQATRKWSPIQECLRKGRVRRGFYLCACCGEEAPTTTTVNRKRVKGIVVDHIVPVVDEKEGFTTWDEVIERMFAEEDNLQLLCLACHKEKCGEEVKVRAEYKALHKKFPREYGSWRAARKRTRCETNHKWEHYGGRGIEFCTEWDDFGKFLEDMGERPEGMTLNRIDNDGNYCAENCEWADLKTQARNKSNTVLLEAFGKVQCVAAWVEETGIPYNTICGRLGHGYSAEESLSPTFKKRTTKREKADG